MLSSEQVAEFDRNGFSNGGKVISDEALDELTAALDAVLEKGPQGFAEGEKKPVSFRDLAGGAEGISEHPVWQIVNIWEAADAFERLIYQPEVVGGLSQLTGEGDLMVWHDQSQYKPAQYGGSTTWHQDAPLWPIPLTTAGW